MTPDTDARIRQSFAQQSMMQSFGATMTGLSGGECTITAPILATNRQQHGFGHAALTFGLGDTAAGYAALSVMAPGQEVLTAEFKINLLAPARGDHLEAIGKVLRAGRRLVTVEAAVWAITDQTRIQVAVLLGTMVPVPGETSAT